MNRYIPREKLTKKRKKAHDQRARASWGAVSPVTRVKLTGKAYKRSNKDNYKNPDNFL
jgi:hypothetical protein